MSKKNYQWAAAGDVNAFFGLMLDNVADLLLTVGLLSEVFAFPTDFALQHMVPGTAIGVLFGDLMFFWMALSLARRTGRNDVTAMPLGLDTPSTFGMVFFVLGPAFLHAGADVSQGGLGLGPEQAAVYTWQIGICAIFISGLFKIACSFGSHWVRQVIPRAGLLGSLAAIALVLISFLPLLDILHHPVVGFVALAIILTTLVARIRFPGRVPGALGALLVAGTIYYLMKATGTLGHESALPIEPAEGLFPTGWLSMYSFSWGEWSRALHDTVSYLPVVIPFALATVVGGIDCTESAAAAGDDYDTGRIVMVEGVATLVASLSGGVIQSTPYIGHPAYKAMGGRAAYTLATALFVGGAGLLGYFGFLYWAIPKAAVFPILIFIGLEITAQSFQATPRRHYPAIVFACIPALAALSLLFVEKVLGDPVMFANGISEAQLSERSQAELATLRMLSNGFIVTSLLWASALAAMIDRRLGRAAVYLVVAAAGSLFGVIHSPFPGSPLFLPWQLTEGAWEYPVRYATAYLLVALLLFAWGICQKELGQQPPIHEEATE